MPATDPLTRYAPGSPELYDALDAIDRHYVDVCSRLNYVGPDRRIKFRACLRAARAERRLTHIVNAKDASLQRYYDRLSRRERVRSIMGYVKQLVADDLGKFGPRHTISDASEYADSFEQLAHERRQNERRA
jgi:hypothetical protein